MKTTVINGGEAGLCLPLGGKKCDAIKNNICECASHSGRLWCKGTLWQNLQWKILNLILKNLISIWWVIRNHGRMYEEGVKDYIGLYSDYIN